MLMSYLGCLKLVMLTVLLNGLTDVHFQIIPGRLVSNNSTRHTITYFINQLILKMIYKVRNKHR